MLKLRLVFAISGFVLFAAPVSANEVLPMPAPAPPAPATSAPVSPTSEDGFIAESIEDYSPTECTGQISDTNDAAEVANRIASLNQNFSQAVESILSSASIVDCAAVTATLNRTTQNINYLHATKGVYKVITGAEPTLSNPTDYIYTFDILSVRYIPYTEGTMLDMANSSILRAIGGTCTTDDLDYPYEADCTFAVTDETNSTLSVGKLHYYF